MAANVTLISNTLVNKYLAHDGRNVAVHDFPTQNAGEFLIKLLFSEPGFTISMPKRREGYICSHCS